METPETPEALAARVEQAYAAYSVAMGGVDDMHRPLAPFADLHMRDQEAWKAATMAALSAALPAEEPVEEPSPLTDTPAAAPAPAGRRHGEAPPLPPPDKAEEPTPRRHR